MHAYELSVTKGPKGGLKKQTAGTIMGFYVRKSIKAGPFRFNLSKSGIGVSAGIKGFRIGTGPRGNYIHMGINGVYYRKTFSSSGKKKAEQPPQRSFTPETRPENLTDAMGYGVFHEIESAHQLVDSTSADLLGEFEEKRKKLLLWPWVFIVGIVACFMIAGQNQGAWFGTSLILTLILTLAARIYDDVRKSIVLFYSMDEAQEKNYADLHAAFDELKSVCKVWHVASHAAVLDRKRNAGASGVLDKTVISIQTTAPAFVKTNISVPAIPVGKQTLYFFPDRLLVFEDNKVGAVSYHILRVHTEPSRFIESERVPQDAQIVDHTWRFVNKSGGPDRRFNNNRQLPICLYEDMHFTSTNGLNELLQLSSLNKTGAFKTALLKLAQSSYAMAEVVTPSNNNPQMLIEVA